ncbi:GIY-YIG nuclease family protein [Pseudomonas frederiksbergensis]|uniref:Bacteriophage T5 Orf172 DNA-binding domain-containing protein n=1 Tax=Pseudomonas frederiksbergensis TaxID=104087 RepID=A0A6L5BR34_9PSED|nr:GIY-YIG nuclease family protein [Pseudomonas frederiksbergensis]KAF2390793.1 hypothetical protein FX983_05260 [Pseudomonas frederiksbergensis]
MTPGYIYVLQNELFGPYVVKIGLTTLEPDTRALQIYNGSTGVPIPFDIVTAYSVGDCKLAETTIHKRLKAFRLNGRREFFRTTPSVAASLAYETCAQINEMLGLTPPKPYTIKLREPKIKRSNLEAIERRISIPEDSQETVRIDPNEIKRAPIGTSALSLDQADRIKVVAMLLSKIFPSKVEEWLEDFTRDFDPERELCVWEHITKAYLTIDEIEIASDDLKNEAFGLLLHRSTSPTTDVLAEATLKHMNKKSAKRLLQAYELKPKPVVVKQRRSNFMDNIKF